ncbi:MAG TPA: hypothetical protein VK177_05350 [Flavobacteriales bacterium]|nr:hypothetical protein [Flavobacteriales bacterium]
MIVIGQKTARLKTIDTIGQPCTGCKRFSLRLEVYRDYMHLFWIPLFPLGRKYYQIYCTSCSDGDNRVTLEQLKSNVRATSWYLFIGTGLILLLVAAGIITMTFNSMRIREYANHPVKNDVYKYETVDHEGEIVYGFLKLKRIKGDSLFFYENKYNYYKSVNGLDRDDCFESVEKYYSRNKIKGMYENGKILFIWREYEPDTRFTSEKKPETANEESIRLRSDIRVLDYTTEKPIHGAAVTIYKNNAVFSKIILEGQEMAAIEMETDNVYKIRFDHPDYFTRIILIDARYIPNNNRYENGWDIPIDMILVKKEELKQCYDEFAASQEKPLSTIKYHENTGELHWDTVGIENARKRIKACISQTNQKNATAF